MKKLLCPEFFLGDKVTPEQSDFFHKNGVIVFRNVLKPETVALMAQNHIGALNVQPMISQNEETSCDVDLFPGMAVKWGLTFLINTQDVPGRRSAGSLAWAGVRNTYYWIDPVRHVGGVFMTQVLPFADPTTLRVFADFERAVYASL